jgi:FkbM family methyltransferase
MQTFIKECRWGRFLLLRGDLISIYTDLYGEWSDLEVRLFQKILKPQSNVVEVGGNLGLHTVPLAKFASKGKIISFEPQRIIFQMLCANVALNNLTNVDAHHAAASDADREIEIQSSDYELPWNYGAFSLTKGMSTEGPFPGTVSTERAHAVKLDTFAPVAELASLDLLKIDAEWHEIAVLNGAAEIIARHRPVIFLENNNERYGDALIQCVEGLGYDSYWFCSARFQPDNFNRVGVALPGADANMVCYPKELGTVTEFMPAKAYADLKNGMVPLVTRVG